ncbi:MAG: hypothetical protein M1832_002379 [Thelocarpon impressellum]|nr:MAG: hypothetical protein M1832_002379 [Thelocarpon impressellum]
MAFSFGGTGAPSGMGVSAQTQVGPDLEEIQVEGLGFLSLSGERKVRLLPTAWPSDALPPPTSSLLSVASNKGLVAAAGPEALVVASTEALRAQFARDGTGDGDIVAFEPQLRIPFQTRISQVAFSADESFLVISAENGGGLAVYDVQAVMQGNTQPSFELPTNGTSLRALTPNPTPEKAELFAVVTVNGDLMMANLKTCQFVVGPNGPVLKQAVSCVSWSTRGKQLVAGLGNGTAHQMTPEGEDKAEIPRPPQGLDGDHHVSSISWLENNLFLIVHTPTSFDGFIAPDSTFNLVTRQSPSSFLFQKLADPAPPGGLNRSPPNHLLLRLKDFPPNLQDMLVVSSTASTDIGLLTRSKTPFTNEVPANKITGVFTTTGVANDSRRAQLSMTEDMNDTSPIGMALDLSSKESVLRPILGEEIEHSPTPLPALFVLNNEGILAAWWIVYSESIRQATAYPGLVAAGAGQPKLESAQQASPFANPGRQATTTGSFGSPSITSQTQPHASPFGKPAPPPAGQAAFGSTPALGNRQSLWNTPSASTAPKTGTATFGSPSFGSSTPLGSAAKPAFGSAGLPGSQSSPWAAPSSATPPSSAFGQTTSLGMRTGGILGPSGDRAFGSPGKATPQSTSSGGFGSYANAGGFAAIGASNAGKEKSVFGKPDTGIAPANLAASSLGATQTNSSGFGKIGFDKPDDSSTKPFTLGTSFKRDGTAKDDAPKPADGGASFFGANFGATLASAQTGSLSPETKEADMESKSDDSGVEDIQRENVLPSIEGTSTANPVSTLTGVFSSSTVGGFFGSTSLDRAASTTVPQGQAITGPLGAPSEKLTKGQGSSAPEPPLPSTPFPPSPEIKPEPPSEHGTPVVDKDVPEAALPPDPMSKATYALGDSSASSNSTSRTVAEDAPLPPDFVESREEDAPLPPDFVESREEDAPLPPEFVESREEDVPLPPDFVESREEDAPLPPDFVESREEDAPLPPDFVESREEDAPLPPDFVESREEDAPLPPDFVESREEDAPLPPDFVESRKEDAPLPPDFVESHAEDAPLPPDFVKGPAEDTPPPRDIVVPKDAAPESVDSGDAPLPPDFLEPKFVPQPSEGERETAVPFSDDGLDGEGSGVDVGREFSLGTTSQSSFMGSMDRSPVSGSFTKVSRPHGQPGSRALFGEMGHGTVPHLPPPPRVQQQSPRSPSPIRSAVPSTMLRPDASRSVSAPGVPSQPSNVRRSIMNPASVTEARSKQISAAEAAKKREDAARAKRQAEEEQDLSDKEDEKIREELATEVRGTTSLDPFLAHQDYVGHVNKPGIPGQIERLYRDINSMIDTLGLNARALKAFTKGHTENYRDGGRQREDLEDEKDWCLVELEDLQVLEDKLASELDEGRVRDVKGKMELCGQLRKNVARLRTKHNDVRKMLDARSEATQQATIRSAPLNSEQMAQRHDLRKELANFQKLLVDAEEGISLLRARLASRHSSNGDARGRAAPTVEAVMNTVMKMTSMAEQKSGDIDVLEIQMRKLRMSSVDSRTSRENSPFATPLKNHTPQQQRTPASSTYGLFYTPDSSRGTPQSRFDTSVASSNALSRSLSTPKKHLSEIGPEEVERTKRKVARRRAIAGRLKTAVINGGPRVRSMDD